MRTQFTIGWIILLSVAALGQGRTRPPDQTPGFKPAPAPAPAPRVTAPAPRVQAPTPRVTAPTPRITAPAPRPADVYVPKSTPTPRSFQPAPTPRSTTVNPPTYSGRTRTEPRRFEPESNPTPTLRGQPDNRGSSRFNPPNTRIDPVGTPSGRSVGEPTERRTFGGTSGDGRSEEGTTGRPGWRTITPVPTPSVRGNSFQPRSSAPAPREKSAGPEGRSAFRNNATIVPKAPESSAFAPARSETGNRGGVTARKEAAPEPLLAKGGATGSRGTVREPADVRNLRSVPGTTSRSDAGVAALGYAGGGFVSGHGTAASIHLKSGHYNLAPYGANPYFFHYSPVPYWYWGYQPWHFGSPYGYGHPYGHHSYYSGGSYLGFSLFSRSWRFRFGFGFSYNPYHYGHHDYVYYRPYPRYRCYSYYPYSYYSTVTYYPAYSTIYHVSTPVSYVESYDPYVDFVDEVPVAAVDVVPAAPTPTLPTEFLSPFVLDFPEDVRGNEAMVRGAAWMKDGRFLLAAESFRRAWMDAPTDGFAAVRVGEALFAAQEYVSLASLAVERGLVLDPSLITRRRDVRTDFPGPLSFDTAMRSLERRAVSNPKDGEARFLLAYIMLFSEQAFAARQEFRALLDGGYESDLLLPLFEESERVLLGR